MVTGKRNMGLPGVEFEGPMGMFWSMEEVPFEAMTMGIAEINQELLRRGYKEDIILEAVKAHSELLKVG
ncbi:hypothetical protein KAT51_08290 [bacterium]|nr:hypothetical protein [bacterium]